MHRPCKKIILHRGRKLATLATNISVRVHFSNLKKSRHVVLIYKSRTSQGCSVYKLVFRLLHQTMLVQTLKNSADQKPCQVLHLLCLWNEVYYTLKAKYARIYVFLWLFCSIVLTVYRSPIELFRNCWHLLYVITGAKKTALFVVMFLHRLKRF